MNDWYDDPKQYIVLVSGFDYSYLNELISVNELSALGDDAHISVVDGESQLRVRETTFNKKYDEIYRQYIKGFCEGFLIGFDSGRYD